MSQWNSRRHEFHRQCVQCFHPTNIGWLGFVWFSEFSIVWLVSRYNFVSSFEKQRTTQKWLRFLIFWSPPDDYLFWFVCTLTNYIVTRNLAQKWNYYSKRKIHFGIQLFFEILVSLLSQTHTHTHIYVETIQNKKIREARTKVDTIAIRMRWIPTQSSAYKIMWWWLKPHSERSIENWFDKCGSEVLNRVLFSCWKIRRIIEINQEVLNIAMHAHSCDA